MAMKNSAHQCVTCGSPAVKKIIDNIKTIFRMEQVYFECGAIETSSYVDRWNAYKVFHEGCPATNPSITRREYQDLRRFAFENQPLRFERSSP
jgi:uncharacterized protein YfcZ (UPF0381/DUF406 family)